MGWFDSFDKSKSTRCFYNELNGKCISCIYLSDRDYISKFFGGYEYKCVKQGGYHTWDERTCRKLETVDPSEVDCVERYKKFTGRTFYYISSMIGLILGKNLDDKPFSNIKCLKDTFEKDNTKQEKIKLYDTYGILISTGLFFDPNRVEVAESLMPILNKVSDLVDNKLFDEAFNIYSDMVMMLYTRYNHSFVNNSEFDYHNEELGLNKQEKSKTLIKK